MIQWYSRDQKRRDRDQDRDQDLRFKTKTRNNQDRKILRIYTFRFNYVKNTKFFILNNLRLHFI